MIRAMLPGLLSTLIVISTSLSTSLAAQRELLETERFPTAEGKVVVIDAADLEVTVRAADIDDLVITTELRISGVGEKRAEAWIAQHTPTFSDSEERLVIMVQPGKEGFLGLGLLTARAHMRVVLPADVIPDITTTSGQIKIRGDFPQANPLRLRTATGDMELSGAAESIDIRTTSGDARVDVMRPVEHFFARTSAGHVTLTGGARQAHVETASGDIWLINLSGPVHATSSTGKITLRWDRLAGESIKVLTASSRIHLVMPESAAPRGELRTITGTIRSDFPGRVNEQGDTVYLEGTGAVLDVETASGQLTLTRDDSWELDTIPNHETPGL
jgi:uncharacterized protein YaiE (UPF0345 family)